MVGSAAWAAGAAAASAAATTAPRMNRLRIGLLLDGQGPGDRAGDAAVGGARDDAQPVAAARQGATGQGVVAGVHGDRRRHGGALRRAALAVRGVRAAAPA